MTDKKYVASYLVDTGASKQNIQEVQDALVKSGDAGVKSASQITQGLQGIEGGSEKALGKIANGAQVSDASLKQLAARFVAVEDGVTKAFGSIEAAPEAIKTAMATAEEQIVAVNTAVVAGGEKVDQMAAQFAAMGQAAASASQQAAEGGATVEASMTAASEATAAAAESMAGAAEAAGAAAESVQTVTSNTIDAAAALQDFSTATVRATAAETELDKSNLALLDSYTLIQERAELMSERLADVTEKIEAGDISMREASMTVKRLAIDYQNLGSTIKAEFGSVSASGQEVSAVYRDLGAEFSVVKEKAGSMALSVRLAADEVAFASGKALNAEKAFAMMAGSMGPAVVKGFLFASMAGVAAMAAEKLAEAIDGDAHVVDKIKESFHGASGSIVQDTYDAYGALMHLVGATLSLDEAQRKAAKEDFSFTLERQNAAAAGDTQALDLLNAAHAMGLRVEQTHKLSVAQAAEVMKFYATTLKMGETGVRELALVHLQGRGEIEKVVAAIKENSAALDENKEKLEHIIEAEKEQQIELTATEKKIRSKIEAVVEEIRNVEQQIKQYGTEAEAEQKLFDLEKKRIDLILNLEVATKGNTRSLAELENAIKDHLPYGERYSQQLAGDGALMSSLIAKTDGLTRVERARLTTISDSAIAIGKSAGAAASLTAQIDKETDALFEMKGADQKAKDAALEHIQALERQRDALSASSIAAKALGEIQNVQAAATVQGTEAEDHYGVAATSTLTPLEQVRAAMAKIEEARRSGTTATTAAAAADTTAAGAAKHHADEISAIGESFKEVGAAVKDHLISQLDDTKKKLDEIKVAADSATASIVKMSNSVNAVPDGGGNSTQYDKPIGPEKPTYFPRIYG